MSPREPRPTASIDDLYRRYGALVYRRARRMLGDEQRAKDACQEVFVRLWRSDPAFEDGPARPATTVAWLYRVTTNHCLNELRAERRRLALDGHAAAPAAGAPEMPLELLLRGIPEELHAVAIYYYVDQMSQDEIALVLGLSQRTVSNRLKHFRSVMTAEASPEAPEVS